MAEEFLFIDYGQISYLLQRMKSTLKRLRVHTQLLHLSKGCIVLMNAAGKKNCTELNEKRQKAALRGSANSLMFSHMKMFSEKYIVKSKGIG